MKKNTKKYLKTNLIGFIIGGLLISGVAVYAAITFPSKEVSYSNISSGLKSTDVQGAIDELYGVCTAEPPASDQIIENGQLEKDPYECRYFFTGANPNNYITFNNEKAGWRIISVGCDGTIKIMRTNSIGNMAWDTSGTNGSNNWNRPATLNTYLNETYYNSLTSTAQSQIVLTNYSIGGVVFSSNDLVSQINDENSETWNGKVALPTVSEYIRSNSNTNSCGTAKLHNNNFTTCINTNWICNSSSWWTLSYSTSYSLPYVVRIESNGRNDTFIFANDNYTAVRPVVTLSSEVQITGGDGSESNPYTIE